MIPFHIKIQILKVKKIVFILQQYLAQTKMIANKARQLITIGSIVQQFWTNFHSVDFSDPKLQVWIIWGPTKAGKTTFFNYISGEVLTSLKDKTGQIKLDVDPKSKFHQTIVHEYSSGTVVPNFRVLTNKEDKKIVVVDLAGQQDTKSIDLVLVNYFMNSKILMNSTRVKFILAVPQQELCEGGKFPEIMKLFFNYFKLDQQQFEKKLFNSTILLITKVKDKNTIKAKLEVLSNTENKGIGKALFGIYQKFIQKSIICIQTPNLLTFEKPNRQNISINGNCEDVKRIRQRIESLDYLSNLKQKIKFCFDEKIKRQKTSQEGLQSLLKLENDSINTIKNDIPNYVQHIIKIIKRLINNQLFSENGKNDIAELKKVNSQIGWDLPEAQNPIEREKRIIKVLNLKKMSDTQIKNKKSNKIDDKKKKNKNVLYQEMQDQSTKPDPFDVLLCLIEIFKNYEQVRKIQELMYDNVQKLQKYTNIIIAIITEIIKLVKFDDQLVQIFTHFGYHFYTTVQKIGTLMEMVQGTNNGELQSIVSNLKMETKLHDLLETISDETYKHLVQLLIQKTGYNFEGFEQPRQQVIIYFCVHYPVAEKKNMLYYNKVKKIFSLAVDLGSNQKKVISKIKRLQQKSTIQKQLPDSKIQQKLDQQKQMEPLQTEIELNPQKRQIQKFYFETFIKKSIQINRYFLPHDANVKKLLPNQVTKYYENIKCCYENLYLLIHKSEMQFTEKQFYARQTIQFVGALIYRSIEERKKYELQKKKEQNKKELKNKSVIVIEQPYSVISWDYYDALKFYECNFDIKNMVKIKRRIIEQTGNLKDYIELSKLLSDNLHDEEALKVLEEAQQELRFNKLDYIEIKNNIKLLFNEQSIKQRRTIFLKNIDEKVQNYKLEEQLLNILNKELKNAPKSLDTFSECTEKTSTESNYDSRLSIKQ